MPERYYTISEAASAAGISRQTLYAWIRTERFTRKHEKEYPDDFMGFTEADIVALKKIKSVPSGKKNGRPKKFRDLPLDADGNLPHGAELGDRLEKHRLEGDLSYAALAARIGVTTTTAYAAAAGRKLSRLSRYKVERYLFLQSQINVGRGSVPGTQGVTEGKRKLVGIPSKKGEA